MHARKFPHRRTPLHTGYSAGLIPVKVTRTGAPRAANDDAHATPAREHTVNPLWMITVGLGVFAVLIVVMLTIG